MRKSLLLSNVLVLLMAGGAAQAADLASMPIKAPVAVAPAFSWTGFYVGAQAGYGWGKNEFSNSVDPLYPSTLVSNDADYDIDGGMVGGQIGFNYQINNIVIGIEADAAWANIKGSGSLDGEYASSCIQSNDDCKTEIDALGTITGRLGYAFDRVLVYAKGGAAWASISHDAGSTNDPDPDFNYSASTDQTRWGWTVGAGVEWAFTNNWSAKIEYNYIDLGSSDVTFNFSPNTYINPHKADVEQTLSVVKVGINYRF